MAAHDPLHPAVGLGYDWSSMQRPRDPRSNLSRPFSFGRDVLVPLAAFGLGAVSFWAWERVGTNSEPEAREMAPVEVRAGFRESTAEPLPARTAVALPEVDEPEVAVDGRAASQVRRQSGGPKSDWGPRQVAASTQFEMFASRGVAGAGIYERLDLRMHLLDPRVNPERVTVSKQHLEELGTLIATERRAYDEAGKTCIDLYLEGMRQRIDREEFSPGFDTNSPSGGDELREWLQTKVDTFGDDGFVHTSFGFDGKAYVVGLSRADAPELFRLLGEREAQKQRIRERVRDFVAARY